MIIVIIILSIVVFVLFADAIYNGKKNYDLETIIAHLRLKLFGLNDNGRIPQIENYLTELDNTNKDFIERFQKLESFAGALGSSIMNCENKLALLDLGINQMLHPINNEDGTELESKTIRDTIQSAKESYKKIVDLFAISIDGNGLWNSSVLDEYRKGINRKIEEIEIRLPKPRVKKVK